MMQEIAFAHASPLPRQLTWAKPFSLFKTHLRCLLLGISVATSPPPSSLLPLNLYMQLEGGKCPEGVDFVFVLFYFVSVHFSHGAAGWIFSCPFLQQNPVCLLARLTSTCSSIVWEWNHLRIVSANAPSFALVVSIIHTGLTPPSNSKPLSTIQAHPVSVFQSSGHGGWFTDGHVTSSIQ